MNCKNHQWERTSPLKWWQCVICGKVMDKAYVISLEEKIADLEFEIEDLRNELVEDD